MSNPDGERGYTRRTNRSDSDARNRRGTRQLPLTHDFCGFTRLSNKQFFFSAVVVHPKELLVATAFRSSRNVRKNTIVEKCRILNQQAFKTFSREFQLHLEEEE